MLSTTKISANELGRLSGPITVRRIELTRVAIPMREPFRISSGAVSLKEALLVKLYDGSAFGWGESSAMPGGFYSAETPDSCEQELTQRLLPALVGQTFPDMAALESFLAMQTESRFVRVAVETAAWECIARAKGVSLRALFGIDDRPIPSGLAVGLYDSDAELLEALDRYQPERYHRVKIKIKRGHDVRLVKLVRERLGAFPLFVDANADYGLEDASVFQELDAEQLMMFEQPFAKEALEESAHLQRTVRTPVCLDESIDSLEEARKAIAAKSCQIVNIKLQRVGGYLEALRIVEECAKSGIPVWMGTMPELGIGSAQALVLAAHAAFAFPTDVEPSARWYADDILSEELMLDQKGCLRMPSGAGLGWSVDAAKLEQYAQASWLFQV